MNKLFLSFVLVTGLVAIVGANGSLNASTNNRFQHANFQITIGDQECPYTKYTRLFEGAKKDLLKNGGLCLRKNCCNNFSQNYVLLFQEIEGDFSYMNKEWLDDEMGVFFIDIQNKCNNYKLNSLQYLKKIEENSDLYNIGREATKESSVVLHPENNDIGFFFLKNVLYQINSAQENFNTLIELHEKLHRDMDTNFNKFIDDLTYKNSMMQLATLFVEASENTFEEIKKNQERECKTSIISKKKR